MKFSLFILFLAGLNCTGASPVADGLLPPQPDSNLTQHDDIGHTPMFDDTFNGKPEQLKKAKQAVADAYLLASTAASMTKDNVFTHYFPEDFKSTNKLIYGNIAGNDGKGKKHMKFVTITTDDYQNKCGKKKDEMTIAYINGDSSKPRLCLCNVAFNFPSIGGPDKITVGDLPDRITGEFATLGYVLVHEFTHWFIISESALGKQVVDHGTDGYGPYNCRFVLNKDKRQENADNYAWFATENYFTIQKGSSYNPPMESDNDLPYCEMDGGGFSCIIQ